MTYVSHALGKGSNQLNVKVSCDVPAGKIASYCDDTIQNPLSAFCQELLAATGTTRNKFCYVAQRGPRTLAEIAK